MAQQQTKNNAKIKNNQLRLLAGIDPKTNLPCKVVDNTNEIEAIKFRKGIEEELRIVDRQTAYRRYKWIDLPKGLNGKLMERILYIKGQAKKMLEGKNPQQIQETIMNIAKQKVEFCCSYNYVC